MLRYITNFFCFFDIFRSQINFKFKSNSSLQTSFGGIISIIIAIIMIVISIFLLVDLIEKNKQSMISSDIISGSYLDIKLNTNSTSIKNDETLFFFAFTLVNRTNNQKIQEFNKFMFIEITEIEKFANNTRKTIGIYSYDKCSNLYENGNLPINQTFIRNWNCIQSTKFRLIGDFFSELYRYIEIRLRFCNYTLNTNKEFCDNSDVIEEKISQVQFQYLILNSLIDPVKINNENPIINQYEIFTTNPNFKFRFSNDIFLTKSKLRSSENLVLPNSSPKEYEFLEISKSLNRYQDITDSFATIYLRSDNKYKLFRRSYKLIFSVLSELGGIFRVLFFIGALFCIPVNLSILYTELSNKIFNLISPDENVENDSLEFYKIENVTSLEASMSIHLFKYDRVKSINYKISEIMTDIFTFGLINTALQKKKKNIFSVAYKKLDDRLNVRNVFAYTNKIKMLRILLLGDYQIILKLLRRNILIEKDHIKLDKKYENFKKKENLPPENIAIYKQMKFIKSIRAIRSKTIIDEKVDCNLINTLNFDEEIIKNYFVAHYHMFLNHKIYS